MATVIAEVGLPSSSEASLMPEGPDETVQSDDDDDDDDEAEVEADAENVLLLNVFCVQFAASFLELELSVRSEDMVGIGSLKRERVRVRDGLSNYLIQCSFSLLCISC